MANERIYIVDDEPNILTMLELWIGQRWGYRVETFDSGKPFLDRLSDPPDLVLLDLMLPDISGVELLQEAKKQYPDIPIIILSAQGSVETAIETLKLGAADYINKPFELPKLEIAIKNYLRLASLSRELENLRESVDNRLLFDNIISQSGEMQEVFKLVNKVKDSDICVLLLGESGTGKELIARAIHYNSNRKSGPFVVVNCASIPPDLLESELFGHEKGAFTGAIQKRIGKFEQAMGGTIFLDEIGELNPSLQAKILRVVQEKQFNRVGGNDTITTDARLISATNRNLLEEVKNKNFREDLYFRLSTFPIVIPPLRQRKTDIIVLTEHFLTKFGLENGKTKLKFSHKALDLLYNYTWPGNVRELENVIRRAVVLADGDVISEKELPVSIQMDDSADMTEEHHLFFSKDNEILPFEKIKENAIRYALKVTYGNLDEAAKKLKIGRATLNRMMQRYKIKI